VMMSIILMAYLNFFLYSIKLIFLIMRENVIKNFFF